MKEMKKLEALITQYGFVPLSSTEEGLLKGGFAVLASSTGNNCTCKTLPNNCRCDTNNCDCPPESTGNDCKCNGNNCNCNLTVPGPTGPPSTASPGAANRSGVGFAFGV